MPRLNRIRIHNIHFDSGGQPRYFHDTTFEPRGLNSLLLLANGGGKTLLLHLVVQVVLPNVKLQERRLKRLLDKEKFTGHILVEWLLDSEMPRFLLTGFCFADSVGSANREVDYFNYLYEYTGRNSWDLASIPLVDEEGRNLNFKQLNDLLRDSPVSHFHSYRRQEYQRKLKTYNIDPREWEHVLRINNSEGGVEEFFEGCSKTRTLMNNLLIPIIDEVLERNEQRDTLQDAFRKVARQAIELPELKVQSDALGELSHRIPRLLTSFEAVAAALQRRDSLREKQARIYQTLSTGLPRLESELQQFDEAIKEKGAEVETARFMLEAFEVEKHRRRWEKQQAEHQKKKEKVQAALSRRDYVRQLYNRLLANRLWEQIVFKRQGLAKCEKQLERAKTGDAEFHRCFDSLKKEALPLLQQNIGDLEEQEAAVCADLQKQEQEAERNAKDKNESENRLQGIEREEYHLHQKGEEFEKYRAETACHFQELNIEFDTCAPEQGLRQMQGELEKSSVKLKDKRQETGQAEIVCHKTREVLTEARHRAEEIGRELKDHQRLYNKWCDEGQALKADLNNLKFTGSFPGEKEAAAAWLDQKEKLLKAEYSEFQKEERHWKEQQDLFGADGAPRPNPEVDRVTEILGAKGIAAHPAVELLRDYPEERRQEMIGERPWLPYAVTVEPAHLENLKRRPPAIARELAIPVPLISREEFYHGRQPQQIYFLSHRGLELFISDEKAGAYRRKIKDELEKTTEKLALIDSEERSVRDIQKQLALFGQSHRHASDQEWKSARRKLEKKLNHEELEKERLEKELAQGERRLNGLKAEQEKLQERINILERALGYGKQYCARWQANEAEREKLLELQGQKKEIESAIAELEQQEGRLALLIREQKEKIKGLQSRREEYLNFRAIHYREEELAALPASEKILDTSAREEHDEMMRQITAMYETLQQKQQDANELYRQIEEYKKDITDRENDLLRLGFQLSDVEANYYAVSGADIERAKAELQAEEQALIEIEGECSAAGSQVDRAHAVYLDRQQQLQKDYPGRPLPDLNGAELIREQARTQEIIDKLDSEREGLQKDRKNCSSWIEDYRRALNSIHKSSAEPAFEVEPFSIEGERKLLLGCALDAVEETRQGLERVAGEIDNCKQAALAALKTCEEELLKLHGDEIRRFFYSLQLRTNEAGWEERVGELRGQLQHALEAIEHLQEHVQQQLSNIDKRIEEMAMRTWRHVDSLLEQLKELHRRARIELRGEKLNLFLIEFKKPDEAESKERIKEYLHRMVEEAARRHQQEIAREEIDHFLDNAVGSAQLLDQVVSLDEISIRLLKPGDFESSYLRKHYDRWDHLNDWSQGQRFAGRFSLFVVLLSYLRHSRAGGRESSSVVLADNPFGKASSSHILEIINIITYYQNVQLFCCTALRNTEILREFPVIYSLVPAPTMSGKERMQLEVSREQAPQALDQAHAYIPGINPGDTGQLRLF